MVRNTASTADHVQCSAVQMAMFHTEDSQTHEESTVNPVSR